MNKGFIDRSPVWFLADVFIIIVGFFAGSFPLTLFGIYDLGIGIWNFLDPDIADSKPFKLTVFILYGLILVWAAIWLFVKVNQLTA